MTRRNEAAPLTPYMFDVLRGVAKGLSNKEIAHQLGVNEKTVKNRLTRIFEKTGCTSRTEAVMRFHNLLMESEPTTQLVCPNCGKHLRVTA